MRERGGMPWGLLSPRPRSYSRPSGSIYTAPARWKPGRSGCSDSVANMSKWMWAAIAAGVTLGGTILAIASPVWIVALVACAGFFWWMGSMDWWQRFFTIALLLLIGAMSRLDAIFVVTDYGRFPCVAALLAVTLMGAHRFQSVRLTTPKRWLLTGLYGTLLLAAASVLWSASPGESIRQLAVFAMLPIILHSLMKNRWAEPNNVRADLRVAVNVLTVVFAAGLVLQYSGVLPAPGVRHYGIFANPNSVAAIGALGVFLAFAVFAEKPSLWRAAPVLIALSCVILSQSRTSFLAVAVGALFIGLRSALKIRFGAAYASLVAAILLLWTGINPLQSVIDRFSPVGGDILSTRDIAWTTAIELTNTNPLGYGWRAGEVVFAALHEQGRFSFLAESVHNSYLQYLLELGWLGLVPLAILVGTVLALAFTAPRKGFGSGLAGLLVAGLVVKVAESVMFGMGSAYPYLFWFAVAAAACMSAPVHVNPRAKKRQLAIRH